MVDIIDDLPDIVIIQPPELPPTVVIVEEVIEVVYITDAPPGPPGERGADGNFSLEELEAAVEDYLTDNPLDIDAPDFNTYFQNGLA